jgi:hypothetical protein
MSAFTVVVLIVVIAVGVAALAWFFAQRAHPEDLNTHEAPGDQPEPTDSHDFYARADRPAGPEAETMDPENLGGDHRPPR